MLGDARMAGSFFTGIPNGLVGDGSVLIALTYAAGKKIVRGFFQRQYSRSVSNSAGLSGRSRLAPPLPRSDADHHALAVDIADLEHRHFCPPHARGVKRHQQGALHEVAGGIDKPGDFLQTEHRRQPAIRLREGQLLSELAPLERSNVEEPERRDPGHHARHCQLALNQQIGLVASQIVWP